MKEFIKKISSGVISSIISALILSGLALISDDIKKLLLSKSVNNLTMIILFIVMLSVIINLIVLIKRKEKVIKENTNKIKEHEELTENYANKRGFKLYKNFAYYKPEEGVTKLYCKPCLDDRKQERVLQQVANCFYDCSSCKYRGIDKEVQDRNIAESERERQELYSGLL
ncbi:MAG: hypothetical protein GX625_14285 [Clostridiaceae bacterium]|nr:hypothetical protein [Clostridiaceae bacterium]